MAVTVVKIPTQLRAAARGRNRDGARKARPCRGPGRPVRAPTASCASTCRDEDRALRRFVNVYVAGEDIRFMDGLDTPVADGSEVTILPAVAGG